MLLVIASLPWSEKLNSILIGLLFLFSAAVFFMGKEKITKQRIFRFLIASTIFFVSIIWLLNTKNTSEGLYYLERTSSGILFPAIFFLVPITEIRKSVILKGFVISVLVRLFYFLLVNLDFELVFIADYWLEFLLQLNQLFKESDLHPTYFSIYLGFSALISLYYFFNAGKSKLWILIFLILTFFNFSLAAKMPLISFVLVVFAYLSYRVIKMKKGKSKKVQVGLMTLVIISLGIGLFKVPNYILQDFYNYYSLMVKGERQDAFDFEKLGNGTNYDTWEKTNRVFIWFAAKEVFLDNWAIGVGTGDVNDELNVVFANNGFEYLERKNTNTHCQPLDFLIRFGLVGFLIVSFAFLWFCSFIKKGNYVLYGIFMFFFVCSFITENLLNRQLGIVFFHFFNNFFLSMTAANETKSIIENSK